MNLKRHLALGVVVLVAAFALAVPAVAAIDWHIALKHSAAFPSARGSAEYQARSGQRELQMEAEHITRLAGKTVAFYANGAKFGTATVTSFGVAQTSRNTELGQSVPRIVHGSTVAVKTAGGKLILSGKF